MIWKTLKRIRQGLTRISNRYSWIGVSHVTRWAKTIVDLARNRRVDASNIIFSTWYTLKMPKRKAKDLLVPEEPRRTSRRISTAKEDVPSEKEVAPKLKTVPKKADVKKTKERTSKAKEAKEETAAIVSRVLFFVARLRDLDKCIHWSQSREPITWWSVTFSLLTRKNCKKSVADTSHRSLKIPLRSLMQNWQKMKKLQATQLVDNTGWWKPSPNQE